MTEEVREGKGAGKGRLDARIKRMDCMQALLREKLDQDGILADIAQIDQEVAAFFDCASMTPPTFLPPASCLPPSTSLPSPPLLSSQF